METRTRHSGSSPGYPYICNNVSASVTHNLLYAQIHNRELTLKSSLNSRMTIDSSTIILAFLPRNRTLMVLYSVESTANDSYATSAQHESYLYWQHVYHKFNMCKARGLIYLHPGVHASCSTLASESWTSKQDKGPEQS
jgi:hypothetical protein